MQKENSSLRREGNKLILTRLLKASRELVWEAWTDPEHIKQWWGPDGFSLTNKSMTLEEGGFWTFIMHGNGQDFDNKIEYTELKRPSLIAYNHSDESGTIHFTVRVTFEESGKNTLLTMTSIFSSEEFLDKLDREVQAIEGARQHLTRLGSYLEVLDENSTGTVTLETR